MGWELAQDLGGCSFENGKTENREGLGKAQQCGIKTIPTMIIYKGEEEVNVWLAFQKEGLGRVTLNYI